MFSVQIWLLMSYFYLFIVKRGGLLAPQQWYALKEMTMSREVRDAFLLYTTGCRCWYTSEQRWQCRCWSDTSVCLRSGWYPHMVLLRHYTNIYIQQYLRWYFDMKPHSSQIITRTTVSSSLLLWQSGLDLFASNRRSACRCIGRGYEEDQSLQVHMGPVINHDPIDVWGLHFCLQKMIQNLIPQRHILPSWPHVLFC